MFVPPPPDDMMAALSDLEIYLHEGRPHLVAAGLAHCQFETIHPFLDGNGRLGRLLITLMLCERQILRRPLLYLSHFLRRHRQQYYDRLTAAREDGDWEGWLKFFMRGVAEVSREATDTARKVTALREGHLHVVREKIQGRRRHEFLDLLYQQPIISARLAEERLAVSYGTANRLVGQFVEAGILEEITGRARYRWFAYREYMDLFADRTLPESPGEVIAETEAGFDSPATERSIS